MFFLSNEVSAMVTTDQSQVWTRSSRSDLFIVALDTTNIPIIHGQNTKRPIKIKVGHYFSFQSQNLQK